MDALQTLIDRAAAALRAAGVDGPRREARLLAAMALECTPEQLMAQPDRVVGAGEARRFRALVDRRAAREPVSRIRGRREFWSLDFTLGPTTLDPRPDSETLVEAALSVLPPDRPARLLDCGTGTGCLLLAVLSERPRATGLGIDVDPDAVALAGANAASCGLADRAEFAVADWSVAGQMPAGPFDLVLANPPYIPTAALAGLAPEVTRYDPILALDGGPDGLDAYRSLAPAIAGSLTRGGFAIVELGEGQGGPVADLFRSSDLETVARRADLAGIPRCLIVRSGPKKPFGDSAGAD